MSYLSSNLFSCIASELLTEESLNNPLNNFFTFLLIFLYDSMTAIRKINSTNRAKLKTVVHISISGLGERQLR